MDITDITYITNQPHVVVFRFKDDSFLTPCYAGGQYGAIDPKLAIFATRDEADAALHFWHDAQGKNAGYYFSIPASVLFDIETTQTFIPKESRR